MAMTLRLSDAQTDALRAQAEREGRSMQQIISAAVEEYLVQRSDDEETSRLSRQGAERFASLLERLGS